MLSSYVWSLPGKYPIKNFTPGEYQAGIQNIDFAQNRDMTLFVANNLGVLSFNGSAWETHALNTGKKQRSLAFDETTNRLYVGSQGEFGYFTKDWQYTSLAEQIPVANQGFDEVWDVFLTDSAVYFCTFKSIFQFDGSHILAIKSRNGFNKSFQLGNRIMSQDAHGKLLEVVESGLSSSLPQGEGHGILAGVVSHKGGLLLIYNDGRVEITRGNDVQTAFPVLSKAITGKYVNHVMQLSDTRLVIATQRAGLYLFDSQSGKVENISMEDGLLSNACLRTYQDYAGNLWVGMQNGMALIDINSPFRLINREINIQGSGYEAFDTTEGTYYTTSNGIYFQASNSDKCVFLPGTEGPAYGIHEIAGKIYAGHHTGLFRLQKNTAIRCANTEGLWHIKPLRRNVQFAIGGTYSGLYLFKLNDRAELQAVKKISGFDESSRFFEEDNEGRIWVGQFYKGLYRLTLSNDLESAQVVKVSDSYALPLREYLVLSRIDEDLYLGTKSGAYRINQFTGQAVQDPLFSGSLGSTWVYLIAQGRQKHIYAVAENAVGFLKPLSAANYVYHPSSLFQLRHSFNNDLLHVSTQVADGVFINANEGFIHYNPEKESRVNAHNAPQVRMIYSVDEDSAYFSRLPFEDHSEVKPVQMVEGVKLLQFFVESYEFKDGGKKHFRYFLQGFDTDYSHWTNATVKEYTNLNVGQYQFYVQTLNAWGQTVTSQPVTVTVTPPFYKNALSKTAYTALVVLALVFAYRWQRQRYKRRAQKVEISRQKELDQKQQELQRLKEERIEGELQHVNSLLAASTMNLVVKNEFMEKIKEDLKVANQKTDLNERHAMLEQLVKEIETNLKVKEDWMQFEYHFDRVHGDFLKRLTAEFTDLTPGEQKLCAFLRLNMDTKEIANLMTISTRGVEIARYRLRKKFKLSTYQNLSKFILEY